jgi:hypothetical protein
MPAASEEYCLLLRTKKGYFRSPAGVRLIDRDSTTACYMCLLTQRPYGPDGLPVTAETCGPGRGCFQSDE